MISRSRIYRLIATRSSLPYSAVTYPSLALSCCREIDVKSRQYTSKTSLGFKHSKPPTTPDFSCALHPSPTFIFITDCVSTMSFDTVVVRVGKPSVDILVYKDLVCSVSSYFRGAIGRSFLGVKEGTITLRDVSETTFRTFLAWCHSQCLPGSVPDALLASPDHLKDNTKLVTGNDVNLKSLTGRGRPRKRIFDEYVSGKSPVLRTLGAEEVDKRFHKSRSWNSQYQEVVKALVRLYIFADRYCIPQLRDDVMSTYIGYCISYGLYPDPDDVEVIDLAYSKLPATAMLSRYLILSTIYFWSPAKLTLESGKLERLHPGFTLDVMTAQAQRGQPPEDGETDATKAVPRLAKYGLRNSCVFHEHQTTSQEYCRHRLTHSKFIFDGLLHACVKEADVVLSKTS
jgi:hypothetical protein